MSDAVPVTPLLKIDTSQTTLGDVQLSLVLLKGKERISGLFEFDLYLTSDQPRIAASAIVGKKVLIEIDRGKNIELGKRNQPRRIHGYVSRFANTGKITESKYRYEAKVVPWLWFLTLNVGNRVFQGMSILQIIEEIWNSYDPAKIGTDWENQTKGPHLNRRLDYCLQYRESDFAFISRLLERNGVYYFFSHETDKHVLVLADRAPIHFAKRFHCPTLDGTTTSEFKISQKETSQASADETIFEWSHEYAFTAGKSTHSDYDYRIPAVPVSVPPAGSDASETDYEVYDFPGGQLWDNSVDSDDTLSQKDLTDWADLRMDAIEAERDVVTGTSNCSGFMPGHKFQVENHGIDDERGKSFVVTEVEHIAGWDAYGDYFSSKPDFLTNIPMNVYDNTEVYNRFACIPASVPCRPPRVTPIPTVNGPQSAVVLNAAGKESPTTQKDTNVPLVNTDEIGRVKVRFHWDRHDTDGAYQSCWVRVSESWAGSSYGTRHIPHVGQEVLVEFLEGDLDRPVITGRVYNAKNRGPQDDVLTLDDGKHRYLTVVARDFFGNEIVMDGTPGQEKIWLASWAAADTTDKTNSCIMIGDDISLRTQGTVLEETGTTVTNDDRSKRAKKPSKVTARMSDSDEDRFAELRLDEPDWTHAFMDWPAKINPPDQGSSYKFGGNKYEYYGPECTEEDLEDTKVNLEKHIKGDTNKITAGDTRSIYEGSYKKCHKGDVSKQYVGATQKYFAGACTKFYAGAYNKIGVAASQKIELGFHWQLFAGINVKVKLGSITGTLFAASFAKLDVGVYVYDISRRKSVFYYDVKDGIHFNKDKLKKEQTLAKIESGLVHTTKTSALISLNSAAIQLTAATGMDVAAPALFLRGAVTIQGPAVVFI
ncbi:MAG: type VI secretion system tip protein VgrG [Planctomycetes bacterium]|nr:type VI secretion system tip protein VgrG [Planctomycetota bacterium]